MPIFVLESVNRIISGYVIHKGLNDGNWEIVEETEDGKPKVFETGDGEKVHRIENKDVEKFNGNPYFYLEED